MSDFNAAQVLAEAYTLYKKHNDGMGLDFKIAINQIREESEQRGAVKALQDFKRFVIRVLPKGLVNRASIIADLDESMKRLNETGRLLMGPLNANQIEQENTDA